VKLRRRDTVGLCVMIAILAAMGAYEIYRSRADHERAVTALAEFRTHAEAVDSLFAELAMQTAFLEEEDARARRQNDTEMERFVQGRARSLQSVAAAADMLCDTLALIGLAEITEQGRGRSLVANQLAIYRRAVADARRRLRKLEAAPPA
jgi:hypothetical protein